ncbi:MAG: hypothetical protein AAF316_01040 [Cyanobacteria bacterium P01_A01_bin.80]
MFETEPIIDGNFYKPHLEDKRATVLLSDGGKLRRISCSEKLESFLAQCLHFKYIEPGGICHYLPVYDPKLRAHLIKVLEPLNHPDISNAVREAEVEVERYYLQQADKASQKLTDKINLRNLSKLRRVALNYSILGELLPQKYQKLSQDWSRRVDELTVALEEREPAIN